MNRPRRRERDELRRLKAEVKRLRARVVDLEARMGFAETAGFGLAYLLSETRRQFGVLGEIVREINAGIAEDKGVDLAAPEPPDLRIIQE